MRSRGIDRMGQVQSRVNLSGDRISCMNMKADYTRYGYKEKLVIALIKVCSENNECSYKVVILKTKKLVKEKSSK